MSYAIIRGNNGRRHEVGFEEARIKVEVYANVSTVELVIEAEDHDRPSEKRRFALVNLPRSEFDKAMADLAREGSSTIKAVE